MPISEILSSYLEIASFKNKYKYRPTFFFSCHWQYNLLYHASSSKKIITPLINKLWTILKHSNCKHFVFTNATYFSNIWVIFLIDLFQIACGNRLYPKKHIFEMSGNGVYLAAATYIILSKIGKNHILLFSTYKLCTINYRRNVTKWTHTHKVNHNKNKNKPTVSIISTKSSNPNTQELSIIVAATRTYWKIFENMEQQHKSFYRNWWSKIKILYC